MQVNKIVFIAMDGNKEIKKSLLVDDEMQMIQVYNYRNFINDNLTWQYKTISSGEKSYGIYFTGKY